MKVVTPEFTAQVDDTMNRAVLIERELHPYRRSADDSSDPGHLRAGSENAFLRYFERTLKELYDTMCSNR